MVLARSLLTLVLTVFNVTLCLASAWRFTDASVTVQGKGDGVGGGFKEKLEASKPLSSSIDFGPSDSLKLVLTAQEGKAAKRPHQAVLLLRDTHTGLDISYPFSVKDSGKAKLDLAHSELPSQFLRSPNPVEADLVLASFGSSTGFNSKVFSLNISPDPQVPIPASEKPLRYGKLPEIHHVFKSDPKSPNVLFSLIFTGALLATVPAMFGSWLYLGGNINHLSKALQAAPVAHGLFCSSIVGIEVIFFFYYRSWNLFQTLPVLVAVGLVAFLSGSRALSEVQERRLAGLR